jgi:hypothetical protein
MTEWQHVKTIGWIELRRRWRTIRGNTAQLLAIAFAGLFTMPVIAITLFGLYIFGAGISSGDIGTPVEFIRRGLVYAWLSVGAFGGYRAYATALRPDRLDGLLTTVSHREVLGGLLFAEALLWGVPVGLFVGLGTLVFAVGVGSLIAAPVAFATVFITVSTAVTSGFILALLIRNLGVRSKLLTRLRTLLLALLGVVYFGVIFTQSFDTVLEPVYWVLAPTPVSWYGDLLLLGTIPGVSVVRALGSVLASGVFLLGSGKALSRLAELLWYADGVTVDHGTTATTSTTSPSRFDGVLSRPVSGVVLTDWKRARRAPITLSFVLYPLIILVNPIITTIQTGTVGSSLPLLITFCGAWVTGALFTLNVLGNEGAVLPATLLGKDPGRSLVRGHIVASVLVGVPLTVVATVLLGITSPRSILSVITLTITALILAACAGPLATGIGTIFPRFEEVSVSRSTKAIVPSLLAFTAYSISLVFIALPALFSHSTIIGHAIASWLGISQLLLSATGTVVTVIIAVPAAAISSYYATHSVETFHFD